MSTTGAASNYLENEILDHVFGKGSYTPPTIYIALCTAAIADDDVSYTDITEANYTGYARKQTAAEDWKAASAGVMKNANELKFAKCTGGSSTVTWVALMDHATTGNVLFRGELSSSLSVANNVEPYFPEDGLSITCD